MALRAGVAPSTVSLVLNGTPGPRIPETTRQRVIQAARELGFRSNPIAKALVTGRTDTIGVVINRGDFPFRSYGAGVLDGFWSVLHDHHRRMLISPAIDGASLAGLFQERCVDGALLIASRLHAGEDAELAQATAARFPAVFVGTCPGVLPVDYIDIDNAETGYLATRRLIEVGHRRILHLAGPLQVNSAAVERHQGYLRALAEAGIAPDERLVIDASFNEQIAENLIGQALAQGLDCTAMFAANCAMARGAWRALRRRGLSIPRDLSIVAIDHDPTGSFPESGISTFEQPLNEIGAEAGRLLLQRIAGDATAPRRMLLSCHESSGATIAPPARRA